ncbi:hypothetical protein AB833_09310 [Chromatiales bacterium (ex Bugula neritina AB1)]|nr:hypothetical protein AB833_09310 [Chromatiales bacterium (ex Bugula neritina AB1)]
MSWPANPHSEGINGYRIFFGPDENAFTSTMITELSVTSLNGSAPHVVYNLIDDLNITDTSEGGCFRVQAYRGSDSSEKSEAVCFTLG